MKAKVLLTRELPGEAMVRLAAAVDLDLWSADTPMPRQELLARAAAAQGLLCMLTDRIDAELLQRSPRLTVVSSMSVGFDHVDVAALTRRGVLLGHTPGVLVDTTADLAFALLLAAARRLPEAQAFVQAGQWRTDNPWGPQMFLGKDVSGATLGIVGLGAIGRAMAQRAAGFGMRVLAWTPSGRTAQGVYSVGLEELLAQSDFVSIHAALSDQTRLLIDAAALARMKRGAVLVNSARGGIVDERALADALRSGQLAAAGIDVFSSEPVAPDNPLLALPNVVLTPHIGSATTNTRGLMASLAVDNLLAALAGRAMPHCVNPEAAIERQ